MSGHPTDDQLVRWLGSGKPNRVGRHLEACEPCLDRLDALSDLDGGLRERLGTASDPPPGFQARAAEAAKDRLAAEEAAGAFVELFALPWRTAAALLGRNRSRGDEGTGAVIDSGATAGHDSDDDGEHRDG
jgi:hypothetical protein